MCVCARAHMRTHVRADTRVLVRLCVCRRRCNRARPLDLRAHPTIHTAAAAAAAAPARAALEAALTNPPSALWVCSHTIKERGGPQTPPRSALRR